MKKNLLFVGLMLALSLSASAQYKGFTFGLKFGPSLNWTGSKTGGTVNAGANMGFDLGVVAEYYFAENYALVTGINVDFLRGHYNYTDKRNINIDTISLQQLITVDRRFKATVYEIPLMLKMVTNQFGSLPIRYFAEVGGAFGYTQRVKVKDAFSIEALVDDASYAATKGEYNPFRASLKIGAGAQYTISGTTRAFAGLYYSHDFLNNISSGAQGITNNYVKYYNGDKDLGERATKLNLLQNTIGLEVGILF